MSENLNGSGSAADTEADDLEDLDYDPSAIYEASETAPPKFPISALPLFWERWCHERAQGCSAPVDYVACSLLASVAGLIGNRRRVQATLQWSECSALWMMLIGNSSSGKTPAKQRPLDLVHGLEREARKLKKPELDAYKEKDARAKLELKIWESEVRKAKKDGAEPPPMPDEAKPPEPIVVPRAIITDATPEKIGTLSQDYPTGLLLHRDELAGWALNFNRYSGGGEREFWLEAYNGNPYTIDRVKHPTIYIPHLNISIVGSIQPKKLHRVTGGEDDGLASRFLFCWPNATQDFELDRSEANDAPQFAALRKIFKIEMPISEAGYQCPEKVPLSDAAQHIFGDFGRLMKRRSLRTHGALGETLGKASGHVLRLAMVLAFLDWSSNYLDETMPPPSTIEDEHIEGAIGLHPVPKTPS